MKQTSKTNINRTLIIVILLGALSMGILAVLLSRGVGRSQQAVPSRAETNKVSFNNTAPQFSYQGGASCWTLNTQGSPRSGAYKQTVRSCGTSPYAVFDTTTPSATASGTNFDQFTFGYGSWSYGGKINVFDGSTSLGSVNSFSQLTGSERVTKEWNSPTLTCSQHTINLKLAPDQSSSTYLLMVDYIDVHPCTPTTPNPTCTPRPACLDARPACTLPTPAGGWCPQTSSCQGNPKSSARCFKCSNQNVGDQVNILDFSCFAKWYGQNVGKP